MFHRYNGRSAKGATYVGDAADFLCSLDPEVADILFLDPPFNLGKRYSDNAKLDCRPEHEYKRWLIEVLNQSIRILKPGAALYLYHLPMWAIRLGSYLDDFLEFRHWIAVSMKGGFVRGKRLYPAHYALLYYTKGPPTYFNRPRTKPAACPHCGSLLKDYGGYRSIIEQKGVNLSDVWDDLSPVRHNNVKHRGQNELPPLFMNRIIAISGAQTGLYVDPFAGSGAGVIAAITAGLRFQACDLVAENCAVIHRRVLNLRRPAAGGGV